MEDLRSAQAKARDAWFESDEGKKCSEGMAWAQYLRNRLELAFLAGYDAAVARAEAGDKFKAYVHQRLDAAGIPTHPDGPHSREGCRVGDRLDFLIDWRDRAERERDEARRERDAALCAALEGDSHSSGRKVAERYVRWLLPDRRDGSRIIARDILKMAQGGVTPPAPAPPAREGVNG